MGSNKTDFKEGGKVKHEQLEFPFMSDGRGGTKIESSQTDMNRETKIINFTERSSEREKQIIQKRREKIVRSLVLSAKHLGW